MVKIEEIEDRPWEKIAQQSDIGTRGKIPMIIHQLVKNKNLIKSQEQSCLAWQRLHPGWYHILWTESDVMDYIKIYHPAFVSTFEGFLMDSQRLEAFRYFVLHDYGGLCTDVNCTPKQSLEECIERGGDLIVAFNSRSRSFTNALMASVPRQEIWRTIWDDILNPKIPEWLSRGKILGASFKSGQIVLNNALAKYPHVISIFPLTTLETDPKIRTMRVPQRFSAWTHHEQPEPSLYTLLQPHRETIMIAFLCIILVTAVLFGRGVSKKLQRV